MKIETESWREKFRKRKRSGSLASFGLKRETVPFFHGHGAAIFKAAGSPNPERRGTSGPSIYKSHDSSDPIPITNLVPKQPTLSPLSTDPRPMLPPLQVNRPKRWLPMNPAPPVTTIRSPFLFSPNGIFPPKLNDTNRRWIGRRPIGIARSNRVSRASWWRKRKRGGRGKEGEEDGGDNGGGDPTAHTKH